MVDQIVDGDGEKGEGEVTEDVDRDRMYDDEEGEPPVVSIQTPEPAKKGAAKKGVTPKTGKKEKDKEIAGGSDTLTVHGTTFEMQFNVKLQSPHIILAQVITSLSAF